MNESKSLSIAVAALCLFVNGCGSLPDPLAKYCDFKCTWDPELGEPRCDYYCEIEFNTTSDADQWGNFIDPTLGTLDTGASNVLPTSYFGQGQLITWDINGNQVRDRSFTWVRSGNVLSALNPSAISSAISGSLGQSKSVTLKYKGITFSPTSGNNVMVAKQKYSGQTVMTVQDSFFCQNSGQPAAYYCGPN